MAPKKKTAKKAPKKKTAKKTAKTAAATEPVAVRFEAPLLAASGQSILRLPKAASKALPSRGQVAVHATIDGHTFSTVIEPDGDFGHWMKLDPKLRKAAGLEPGESVRVEVERAADWPEPKVPPDLKQALAGAPKDVRELWQAITPMARWEWVRWINETKNPATRARRVEVGISKLSDGKRRPCCFNLASCTDPELSKSGKLVLL